MKYLPLPNLDDVSSALNFETADLEVIGGCELFTTKACGGDVKLYRDIEDALEAQHQSLLRATASLTSPDAGDMADQLNLSRSSPFGPLTQSSNRSTYKYLIATLNASYPDYEFSNILRPFDFRSHASPSAVKNSIDDAIYHLLPRAINLPPPPSPDGNTRVGGSGTQIWGQHMWRAIDQEMVLKNCEVYSYVPEDDPFDGELGAIWSLHYFLYNKRLKRVCYIHLRAQSVLSHTPPPDDLADAPFSPYSPYSPQHKSSMGYDGAMDAVVSPMALARKKRASGKGSADVGHRKRNKPSDGAEAYDVKAVGSGKGADGLSASRRSANRLAGRRPGCAGVGAAHALLPLLLDSSSEGVESPQRDMSVHIVGSDGDGASIGHAEPSLSGASSEEEELLAKDTSESPATDLSVQIVDTVEI